MSPRLNSTEINEGKNFNWTDKYKFPTGARILIFYTLLSVMGVYCYILSMPVYMASILGFSDTKSTVIHHAKSSTAFFMNIFGAVIVDSLLGRLKTSLLFEPINILIILGLAVISIYKITAGIIVFFFGLGIVSGCLSPAIRTFTADQIPSNDPIMLSTYLHIIYLVNNFGVIIIAFVAPIIHKDIHCFGVECYPLLFGVSFTLIFMSFCVFLCGYCCNRFNVQQPTSNLFPNIIQCLSFAIKKRIKFGNPETGKTFLDYAEGEFDPIFIRDLKVVKGLCVFLLAHPLFYTVFDQVSSVWTLQAQYMNGMITDGFVIKPVQMQTLNPMLVVILIPIFEIFIYPFLNKINFQVPYRIVAGQLFTGLCCVSMIFIQIRVDSSSELSLPKNTVQANFANFCGKNISIKSGNRVIELGISRSVTYTLDKDSFVLFQMGTMIVNKTLIDQGSLSTMLVVNANIRGYEIIMASVKVQKNGGYSYVRAINIVDGSGDMKVILKAKVGINIECDLDMGYKIFGEYVKCGVGEFNIFLIAGGSEKNLGRLVLYPAETKTFVVEGQVGSENVVQLRELILKLPSIFLQIIPYVLVTIGEVLFNVNTGIFLYGEAPKSMKSILLAGQYVCMGIGNVLIIALKETLSNVNSKYLFLICGVLVIITGIITAVLGHFYLRNKKIMDLQKESTTTISEF